MSYRFIDAKKAVYPVEMLCRVLQVSRSGFYAWRTRSVSARAKANARLLQEIVRIHAESRRTYGSPRVHQELRAQGVQCGRHRVARLMRSEGLRARQRRRFKATTDSRHKLPVAPNRLERCFQVDQPNRAWVTDISVPQQAAGEMRDCGPSSSACRCW